MTQKPISPQAQKILNHRLTVAVNGGHLDETRQLLKDGADPNFREAGEEPLISFAAEFDAPVMVQLLIDYGADVTACDEKGVTPLKNALICAHFDTAALLMKHGADLNQQMIPGVTIPPLATALLADRSHNSTDRTEFVLRHAPDLDTLFTYGDKEGCSIVGVMESYLETGHIRQRPVVQLILDMLNVARAAAEDARVKDARAKCHNDLRQRRDKRFKL